MSTGRLVLLQTSEPYNAQKQFDKYRPRAFLSSPGLFKTLSVGQ